jgi:hypothetical protein
MHRPLFFCGLAIWIAATIALRVAGQYVLRPGNWMATLILFGVSFPAMAWIVRRLCRTFLLAQDDCLRGAFSVALPTLLLDPFSSVFFPVVFPNMRPEVAGVFGGWILWCCAGAFVGASIHQRK